MKLNILLAAAALAFGASAALADDSYTLDLLPTVPGVSSASFAASVTGLFVDSFSIGPLALAGSVGVSLTSLGGPVRFFVGSLNDASFGFLDDAGTGIFQASFQSAVAADTPLTVTVFGAVLDADGNPAGAGRYDITVTAVPEPQTVALMLAGLAVVGVGVRRRRQQRG